MKSVLRDCVYLLMPYMRRKGLSGGLYLTFDDGPHPHTLETLAVLKRFGVKATFFMVGQEMIRYPDVVKAVLAEGHAVGYHSFSHNSLKKMTFFEVTKDVASHKEIWKDFGIKTKLYRPPYGDLSPLALIWLVITGWKVIMWSLDSRDSFDSPEQVVANLDLKNLSSGEIILFHDDYDSTPDVLDVVLSQLKSKNLQFRVC